MECASLTTADHSGPPPARDLTRLLRLDSRLSLAQLALGGAVVWTSLEVLSLALPRGAREAALILLVFNGPCVALYGSLLAALMSRPSGAISSVLFLCLGLTHVGWVLVAPTAIGWAFRNPTLAPFSGQTDAVAMFAVTGIVFGILIAIATQRLSSLGWMAMATTASLVVCTFSRDLAAVAAAPINLAIAIPMYVEVRRGRTLALSRRLGSCAHCGYDLTGISPTVCPECGSATRPANTIS